MKETVFVPGFGTFKQKDLEEATVATLRKYAQARNVGTGVWRAGASKEALIQGLLGDLPQEAIHVPPQAQTPEVPANLEAALGTLRALIGVQEAKVDEVKLEARIKDLVSEGLKSHKKDIVVTLPSGDKKEVGKQHKNFDLLLKLISQRIHCFLVGPAGSGKTMAAEKAAEALGLSFSAQSVGPQTTQTHLFGYMDAQGRYVTTEFRKRYQDGGIFLLDEIDAGNPAVLTCVNSALANGSCAFPDGMVTRHNDFICIASGNTYGVGASREYVGRNPMDAATLNRFAVIDWPYDEALEREICSNQDWVKRVQAIRASVDKLKLRIIVSPRASIYGEKMLACGVKQSQVEDMLIFYATDRDTKAKVLANTGE